MKPASPAQAAAIAAAIELFRRATAPPASSSDEPPDPWIRAAILEGVTREDQGLEDQGLAQGLAFPALG